MKVNVNDNAIFSAGLAKADAGEYFDALCLFARVEGYESMLNQIGCLCALHDVGYATELYRMLLAKYYFTHNCDEDVTKLGDAVELISAYMGNDKARSRNATDKLSACEEMLAFYTYDYDDYYDGEDVESLAEALEYTVGNASRKSIFCDVKSPEFALNLYQRMERALLDGKYTLARELSQQFMTVETDDEPTLEMQMFLCATQHLWVDGVKYALRYADLPNVTARGLGVATQILFHAKGEYKDVIEQLLVKLSEYGEEIADLAMMDYVQIASVALGYGDITLKLAEILYGHYKEAGCSALMLVSRIFFNCGKLSLARDAILLLLRAVPWDGVAYMYLTYFNKHIKVTFDDVTTGNSLARYFDIPTQLSVVAQYDLFSNLDQNSLYLDESSFPLIQCLFKVCLGCIVKGDADSFYKEAHAFGAVMVNFIPQDKEEFFRFAKDCLAGILSEPSLNKEFLCKMIELGYRDSLVMSTASGFYALNLKRLAICDKVFLSALAIGASLREVSVTKLENTYKRIKETINVSFEEDIDTVRQLAYALLALSYKRFLNSDEKAYFSQEEHALYDKYMQLK